MGGSWRPRTPEPHHTREHGKQERTPPYTGVVSLDPLQDTACADTWGGGGGATTIGPDVTHPPAICQNLRGRGGQLGGGGGWFLFWLPTGQWSLAPTCLCTRDVRHGNAEHTSVLVALVPAHRLCVYPRCVPRTWSTGPPHYTARALIWSSTCSLIAGEEMNYCGPLAELDCLQCHQHVHMVR